MNAFAQMAVDSSDDGTASWMPPDLAASIAGDEIVGAATDLEFSEGMLSEIVALGRNFFTQTVVGGN
jgi:hypothetical protein